MKHLCVAIFLFWFALPGSGGVALRLYYNGIDGGRVSDLTNHPSFPKQPTLAQPITEALEELHEKGDSFGTWTRGFLEAPQTGKYIFMLASDDESEFWLSTSPGNSDRRLIASTLGFVSPRNYSAQPSQQSAPIALSRGEKYYFELFHKDHVGYDHISLAWRLPDGTMEAPIPASRLLPLPMDADYAVKEHAPLVLSQYHGQPVARLTNAVAQEGDAVTFSVTVEANPPPSFQWMRNHVPIPNAILSSYTLPRVNLTNDIDLFSVVISNKLGTVKREAMLNISQDNTPPVISSSLLLQSNQLAVLFSEPVDATTALNPENYEVDGSLPTKVNATDNPQILLLELTGPQSVPWNRLDVRNIKDQARPPNVIAPATYPIEPRLKAQLRRNDPCLNFDGGRKTELEPGMADFVSGFSIALWARPTAIRKGAPFVEFSNGNFDTIRFGRLDASQNLAVEIADKGLVAVNGIELDSWQHFAATLERNGSISLYKNGAPLITMPIGIPKVIWRTNNFVGRSSLKDRETFQGQMDDVRVYARTLSPEEIKLLARELPQP